MLYTAMGLTGITKPNVTTVNTKAIQMIYWLFLVTAMYCQASSSQFFSITQPLRSLWQLAEKGAQVHAVGSNSLETTYILFELPQ